MGDQENRTPDGGKHGDQPKAVAPRRGAVVAASPAQRRWRIVWRTLGVLSCLCAMAGGAVFGHLMQSKTIRDIFVNHGTQVALDTLLHQDPTLTWTPERQFPDKSSMNVLVLGVDHDWSNSGAVVPGSYGRSDSILLCRVDFVDKTINALTIPRDSAVRIAGHPGVHKINAAHEFGGPQLAADTVESVFGVHVDSTVVVGLEAFQKIVDAIGGVDVNVEKKLDYDDNWGHLHIHLRPGFQRLNGYNAMCYVRMRHSDSDEMRSKRQHEFLEALRTKLESPTTFGVLPHVVDTVRSELTGGMSTDQMLCLANFARELPKENIHVETLPSFEGPSFVTIYPEKSAAVIRQMFFPYQQVALNPIDVPDPNHVLQNGESGEYPGTGYMPRHRRHTYRSRRHARGETPAPGATQPAADTSPATDTSGDTMPTDGGSQGAAPGGQPDTSSHTERAVTSGVTG